MKELLKNIPGLTNIRKTKYGYSAYCAEGSSWRERLDNYGFKWVGETDCGCDVFRYYDAATKAIYYTRWSDSLRTVGMNLTLTTKEFDFISYN